MHFNGMVREKEVITLLKDLISIDSVNPLEDTSRQGEKKLAFHIRDYLKNIGIQSSLQWVLNERPNVIGILEGVKEGKGFVLEAHMDTVKADNMTIDPFLPRIKEGKMFGRGACDDKGSLAAMLLAMKLLKEKKIPLKGRVYLAMVVDEEYKYRGVSHLLREGFRADAGIVGEPTNLDIIIAHRGAMRWRIVTKGVACHSSETGKEKNAIYSMTQVINALQKRLIPAYKKRLHTLIGCPTLSINIIQGGTQINIVPDRCFIEIDRRTIPGEDYKTVLKEVDGVLNELRKENPLLKIEREEPYVASPSMEVDKNERVVEALFQSIKENIGSEPKVRGGKFDSDAGKFIAQGIPTPVFGPGNILEAHSKDEWIEMRQVMQAAEIIAQTIVTYQDKLPRN